MYSNSLARPFSSMFHTKCLLPRLDRLLPVRSCLQNFYQCTMFNGFSGSVIGFLNDALVLIVFSFILIWFKIYFNYHFSEQLNSLNQLVTVFFLLIFGLISNRNMLVFRLKTPSWCKLSLKQLNKSSANCSK